jgi:hypothetical protein
LILKDLIMKLKSIIFILLIFSLSVMTSSCKTEMSDDLENAINIDMISSINSIPEVKITSPSNNSVFSPSDTITFSCTVTDKQDGSLPDSSIVWDSNIDGLIGTGTSIKAILSPGTHTITVTATNSDSYINMVSIIVRISTPPTALISVPSNNSVYSLGTNITFTGTGTDNEDGALIGSSLVWSSNIDGVLGNGTTFSTSSLSAGSHTITLTATDSSSYSGTDTVNVVVVTGTYDTANSPEGIKISGKYAYILDGGSILSVDISNPSAPILADSYKTPSLSVLLGIDISGNYAYLVDINAEFFVIDISNPSNLSLRDHLDISSTGSAYDVVISGNFAYVATGDSGLKIIDISNPSDISVIATYDNALQDSAWGVAVSGNYVYLADYSRLIIINVSDPYKPVYEGSYETGALDVAISGNHAIIGGFWDFVVLDISDPTAPMKVSSIDSPLYTKRLAIDGNYVFVAGNDTGFRIIDISNFYAPSIAAEYGENDAYDVDVSGNYAYVLYNDGLRIFDISSY